MATTPDNDVQDLAGNSVDEALEAVSDVDAEHSSDPMEDWESALEEQNAAASTQLDQASPAADSVFKPLSKIETGERTSLDIEALKDVPVQMTVELGRTRMTIRELLHLGQGSVVDLATMAGEPLDILVNGHLIAQGEVVVVDDNYGVRLTDILTPSDRLSRLAIKR